MGFKSLKDIFDYQVEHQGRKKFLVFPQLEKEYTYEETNAIADKLANFFNKIRLKKGDIIATFLDNSSEIIFMYLACFKLGITILPVDPYFSQERIRFILDSSKPAFAVIGEKFYDKLKSLITEKKIHFISDRNRFKEGENSIENIMKRGKAKVNYDNVSEEDVATLVFTSGTTGVPKGVPLKNKHFLYNIPLVAEWLGLDMNDNFLCVTPLYYNHGYYNSMLFVMYVGGTLTVTENFNIFIAKDYWDYVSEYKVTVLSVVPPIIETLNRLYAKSVQTYDLPHVKFAISGTAPLNKISLERFEKNFGVRIIRQYGLIETLLVVWDDLSARKPDSTGKAVAGKIYIADEEGNRLGANKEGEVVIDSKSVIDEYFHNADLTKKAIRGGLFFTGDIGYIDKEGYLYLRGRKDDMINKGGNKISPIEIEEVISSCKFVKEVAVIGIPDEIYGEDLFCFVAKQRNALSNNEVIEKVKEACIKNLQPYWCPARFKVVESIPRGPTGKILRTELKKILN